MKQLFTDNSRWIWLDNQNTANQYMEAYAEFDVCSDEPIALHISVEGQYAALVNGQRVESTQYTDFPFAKSVQCPEITQFLRSGRNTLTIQCWYPGEDTSVTRREDAGLRFEVQQGDRVLVYSSENTQVRPITAYQEGPVTLITGQLGSGFVHHHAEHAPWSKAVCVDKEAVCVLRPIKELRIESCPAGKIVSQGTFEYIGGKNLGEKMQTAGMFWQDLRTLSGQYASNLPADEGICLKSERGDGIYVVIDLGKLYEGYYTHEIVTPEYTQVDVGFGEHIEDLRVRTSVGGRCFAVTCAVGPERSAFVHRFKRLGFRYLQLFIHSKEAIIYQAGLLPAYYPVDERPAISISDPLHNQIAATCRETLVACMHDHYEDCPWREQALYAFDSRNQMLAGYYAFGEYTFARENIRLLAMSQREDGLLELCAPARIPITIPTFSLAFIVELEEYCRFSGDLDFGREMLPTAERIVDALGEHCRDGMMWRLKDPKYWNFYEWQPMLDGYSKVEGDSAESVLQMFFILALKRLADLRSMLGSENRACERNLLAVLIDGAEKFWDEEAQAYASFIQDGNHVQYSELIQSLALLTDVVPESRREALRRKLYRNDDLVPVTLSYSLFKYEALLQDAAYTKPVFDEIARRWGAMLFKGATTFWEVDEGAEAFSRAGSLCHGWSAIPYYLYGAYGLGVQPANPGEWKAFKRYSDLEISATLVTPEGCFEVCTNGAEFPEIVRRGENNL